MLRHRRLGHAQAAGQGVDAQEAPISALVLWGVLAAILPGAATAYELVNVMVTSYDVSGAGQADAIPLCRRGARMSLECAERAGRLTCNARCDSADGIAVSMDLNKLGLHWQRQVAHCPQSGDEAVDSFRDVFNVPERHLAASLVERREARSRSLEVQLGLRRHPKCAVVMKSGSLDYPRHAAGK